MVSRDQPTSLLPSGRFCIRVQSMTSSPYPAPRCVSCFTALGVVCVCVRVCPSVSVCNHPAVKNAAMTDDGCYSHERLHSLQEATRWRHREEDASIMLMALGTAGDTVSSDSSDASASLIFFFVLNSGCATYQEADKTGSEAHQWTLAPAERKQEGDGGTLTVPLPPDFFYHLQSS